jgi:hypothetical protein
MNGSQLLGVLEILSSRANAFGQRDLASLKALSLRILQGEVPDSDPAAQLTPKDSMSFLPNFEEDIVQNETHASEHDRGIVRPKHAFKATGLWTPILGVLVIGMALLLGAVVGWRLGWQKATLQFQKSSTPQRANAQSKAGLRDVILLAAVELQPSSRPAAGVEVARSQIAPPGDGTTIGHLKNPRSCGAFGAVKCMAVPVDEQKDILD